MDRAKPQLVELLHELFAPRAIVERNDVAVRKIENLPRLQNARARRHFDDLLLQPPCQ